VSLQIEKNLKINTDIDANERVQNILDRIVEVCDRQELVYVIKVIDEDKMNAVSLPGGYIYVFKGFIDKVKSDDELASVIAHEVGHITARHGIKRLQSMYGYTLLQVLAVSTGDRDLIAGTGAIYTSVFLAYSRQDEHEADKLGVKYLRDAGYDVTKMHSMLKNLKTEQDKTLRPLSYFRTHPYLNERMANVNKEIKGELEFRDYLNLTGNEP